MKRKRIIRRMSKEQVESLSPVTVKGLIATYEIDGQCYLVKYDNAQEILIAWFGKR